MANGKNNDHYSITFIFVVFFKGLVYFGTFKKSIFIFLHFSKVYVSKNTEQASLIKFR